jgi:hypothetical protein
MQHAAARTADATRQEQAAEAEATTTADRVQQLRDRLNQDAKGDATVAACAFASSASSCSTGAMVITAGDRCPTKMYVSTASARGAREHLCAERTALCHHNLRRYRACTCSDFSAAGASRHCWGMTLHR